MLIAKLPRARLKHQGLLWLLLVPIQLSCFAIVCFGLGNVDWWGGFRGVEFILDIVLYPALIYLTFQLEVSSRALNYLGALSFGLYAFQCPADLLRLLGVDNRIFLLSLIVGAAVIEDAGKRLWRRRRISVTVTNEKGINP